MTFSHFFDFSSIQSTGLVRFSPFMLLFLGGVEDGLVGGGMNSQLQIPSLQGFLRTPVLVAFKDNILVVEECLSIQGGGVRRHTVT